MAEKKVAKKAAAKKTTAKKPLVKKPSIVALKEKAGAVKSHGGGFMMFIREQGVVGLAVGLAIGTAAGDSVYRPACTVNRWLAEGASVSIVYC